MKSTSYGDAAVTSEEDQDRGRGGVEIDWDVGRRGNKRVEDVHDGWGVWHV